MKVSFKIYDQDDAANAVGVLLAIEDAFKLISGDLVAARPTPEDLPPVAVATSGPPAIVPAAAEQPAAPKRGRPKKADNGTSDKSANLHTSQPEPAPAPNGDALPNGHNHEQPDLFQNEDIEIARDRLRTVAQEKGVAWLRPQLEARGAKRMSDLSDLQVREFLRDQA